MRCVDVFFFKKKTAYDMRISDWSSDVCSSDLGSGIFDHFVILLLDLVPVDRAGEAEEGVHLLLLREGGDQRPVGVLGIDLAQQIGSASCRERVCQYV